MIFTLKPNISSETSAQVLEGRSVPLNKYRGQLFLIEQQRYYRFLFKSKLRKSLHLLHL